MSELHNPLFDDEREFLERQKLEYERALLGDVDHLKDQTTRIGKYVAIGAALLGGFWIVSKVIGRGDEDDEDEDYRPRRKVKGNKGKRRPHLVAQSEDYEFGSGRTDEHPRAHLAPAVYHATAPAADSDPFPAFEPQPATNPQSLAPVPAAGRRASYRAPEPEAEPRSSVVWEAVQLFAASNTGKMLIGQVSGVLIALVTRKLNDLMDVSKNSDLAASAPEPETKDIDFVIHHDDAHAPDAPAR
ncbi:hypothetical protein [Hymenobacter edaphi]|uniref:Uncharacterized protein n=1 Tax=Hymenobacter edaphi TaxID=2211146 RepID=A0A328BB57_9BACT|nr:hypothetical protein [Hymenobacter edaphi]RAK64542.1 hypothetical protein DLM85_17760 [Hymenobacter edaphi]